MTDLTFDADFEEFDDWAFASADQSAVNTNIIDSQIISQTGDDSTNKIISIEGIDDEWSFNSADINTLTNNIPDDRIVSNANADIINLLDEFKAFDIQSIEKILNNPVSLDSNPLDQSKNDSSLVYDAFADIKIEDNSIATSSSSNKIDIHETIRPLNTTEIISSSPTDYATVHNDVNFDAFGAFDVVKDETLTNNQTTESSAEFDKLEGLLDLNIGKSGSYSATYSTDNEIKSSDTVNAFDNNQFVVDSLVDNSNQSFIGDSTIYSNVSTTASTEINETNLNTDINLLVNVKTVYSIESNSAIKLNDNLETSFDSFESLPNIKTDIVKSDGTINSFMDVTDPPSSIVSTNSNENIAAINTSSSLSINQSENQIVDPFASINEIHTINQEVGELGTLQSVHEFIRNDEIATSIANKIVNKLDFVVDSIDGLDIHNNCIDGSVTLSNQSNDIISALLTNEINSSVDTKAAHVNDNSQDFSNQLIDPFESIDNENNSSVKEDSTNINDSFSEVGILANIVTNNNLISDIEEELSFSEAVPVKLETAFVIEDTNVFKSVINNNDIDTTAIALSSDNLSNVEVNVDLNVNILSLTTQLIDPFESIGNDLNEVNSSDKANESTDINDSVREEEIIPSSLPNNNIISDIEEDDWSFSDAAQVKSETTIASEDSNLLTSANNNDIDITAITSSSNIISTEEVNLDVNTQSLSTQIFDPFESIDNEIKVVNSLDKVDESSNVNESLREEEILTNSVTNNNIINGIEENEWSFSDAALAIENTNALANNNDIDFSAIASSNKVEVNVDVNINTPSLPIQLVDPFESIDNEIKEINSSIKVDESTNINGSFREEEIEPSSLLNKNIISDFEEDWSFSEAAPLEAQANSQGGNTNVSFNETTVEDDDDDWAFSEAPPADDNHIESPYIQNKDVDSSKDNVKWSSNEPTNTSIDMTNHSMSKFDVSFDDDDWTATTTTSLPNGLMNAIEISYLNSFDYKFTQNQQLEFDRLREISKELFQLSSLASFTADSKSTSPLVIDFKPLSSSNISEDEIRIIYELALSTIPNDAVIIEDETPVFLGGHISTSLQSTDSLDEDVNESNKQTDNQSSQAVVTKVNKDIDNRASASLDTQIVGESKKSTVQLFIDKLPDLTYILQ